MARNVARSSNIIIWTLVLLKSKEMMFASEARTALRIWPRRVSKTCEWSDQLKRNLIPLGSNDLLILIRDDHRDCLPISDDR